MINFSNAASYWAGISPSWITLGLITDWGGIIYGSAPTPPSGLGAGTLLLLGVGK